MCDVVDIMQAPYTSFKIVGIQFRMGLPGSQDHEKKQKKTRLARRCFVCIACCERCVQSQSKNYKLAT